MTLPNVKHGAGGSFFHNRLPAAVTAKSATIRAARNHHNYAYRRVGRFRRPPPLAVIASVDGGLCSSSCSTTPTASNHHASASPPSHIQRERKETKTTIRGGVIAETNAGETDDQQLPTTPATKSCSTELDDESLSPDEEREDTHTNVHQQNHRADRGSGIRQRNGGAHQLAQKAYRTDQQHNRGYRNDDDDDDDEDDAECDECSRLMSTSGNNTSDNNHPSHNSKHRNFGVPASGSILLPSTTVAAGGGSSSSRAVYRADDDDPDGQDDDDAFGNRSGSCYSGGGLPVSGYVMRAAGGERFMQAGGGGGQPMMRSPVGGVEVGGVTSPMLQNRPRMGRRFTLNPLIFAKEERDARRQSLAQLKLSYYPTNANPETYDNNLGICSWSLICLSWLFFILTLPISVCFCMKVVQEYERAVMFRLGRLIGGGARGPGIFFVMPCIESYTKVDLRTVSFSVPPQEILTRDSVTVSVDAVVYYRVCNATVSVANVENAHHSTRLLAQTTLRNMLGMRNLSEILSDRECIAGAMQTLLDDATESWGIKVERVEIKDVRLPIQLQRAMAAEAEAAREARAKIIAAEGEQKASRSLRDAATIIAMSPAAIQLRYLQTLNSVAAEKNSTIIFPLPIELIRHFIGNDGGSVTSRTTAHTTTSSLPTTVTPTHRAIEDVEKPTADLLLK